MDLQAAIGIHQLRRLEDNWRRREQIVARYRRELASLPVQLPAPPAANTRHSHHLFTLLIDEQACGRSRDAFVKEMTRCRIGVGVHYVSIPEHPYYQRTFGWKPQQYPHAARIGAQTVSIPLSAKLTDQDVTDVIDAVKFSLRR
jgi:dTDP-4-amino-4,6-dideoxygalactose transaminase